MRLLAFTLLVFFLTACTAAAPPVPPTIASPTTPDMPVPRRHLARTNDAGSGEAPSAKPRERSRASASAIGTFTPTPTTQTLGETFALTVVPYTCLRQTGSASLLRVLLAGNVVASVSIVNPTVGRAFTMQCQVTAEAVALSVNGTVRLTVAVP